MSTEPSLFDDMCGRRRLGVGEEPRKDLCLLPEVEAEEAGSGFGHAPSGGVRTPVGPHVGGDEGFGVFGEAVERPANYHVEVDEQRVARQALKIRAVDAQFGPLPAAAHCERKLQVRQQKGLDPVDRPRWVIGQADEAEGAGQVAAAGIEKHVHIMKNTFT